MAEQKETKTPKTKGKPSPKPKIEPEKKPGCTKVW